MGYTIRTRDVRFTWWMEFNKRTFTPDWGDKAAIYELYDYSIDPEGNENKQGDVKYQGVKDVLKARIISKISIQ